MSPAQAAEAAALRDEGYCVRMFSDWEDAAQFTLDYLSTACGTLSPAG
jgi:hypothetical protein